MGDQSARAPGRFGRETSHPEPKADETSSDVGRASGEAPGGDARAHPLSEASRAGEPDDGQWTRNKKKDLYSRAILEFILFSSTSIIPTITPID